MGKIFVHSITVVGTGPFPIDMLRYDQCFPATEDDAGRIAWSLSEGGRTDEHRIKLARLSDSSTAHWTKERWHSFRYVIADLTLPARKDRLYKPLADTPSP